MLSNIFNGLVKQCKADHNFLNKDEIADLISAKLEFEKENIIFLKDDYRISFTGVITIAKCLNDEMEKGTNLLRHTLINGESNYQGSEILLGNHVFDICLKNGEKFDIVLLEYKKYIKEKFMEPVHKEIAVKVFRKGLEL